MKRSFTHAAAHRMPPTADGPPKPGILAGLGIWTINLARRLTGFISLWAAVMVQGCRPLTWRRTVRREFVRQCFLVGVRALPLTLLTGGLVGLGLVFQALYWLEMFGESDMIAKFLVLVLVRELSPMLVGIIVLGRSGSAMLVEMGTMKAGGQVRMLDSMGIDPFLVLLLPRVLATSLCSFSLTVVFVGAALGTGFVASHVLAISPFTLIEFIEQMLDAMGPTEFALMVLKPLFIGFAIALISCTIGLKVSGSIEDVPASLPGGFVSAVIAIFLFSGIFSVLL